MIRAALVAAVALFAMTQAAFASSFERTFTGSGMHARVTVVSPLVGSRILRVALSDLGGHPIRHARVAVHVDMALMAMNPPGDVPLAEKKPGQYERSIPLTMPGHWKADVRIVRTSGAATHLSLPFFVDLP